MFVVAFTSKVCAQDVVKKSSHPNNILIIIDIFLMISLNLTGAMYALKCMLSSLCVKKMLCPLSFHIVCVVCFKGSCYNTKFNIWSII